MAKAATKNNDSAANLALERDNPRLKGVLPKDYARPALDKHRLGELIDLIGTITPLPSPAGGRGAGGEGARRDRRKQTLFIDARKLGTLVDRVHRELTDEDIAKIASAYHAWRGGHAADTDLTRRRGERGGKASEDLSPLRTSA